MLTRRLFTRAAPALILTPGILMPIKKHNGLIIEPQRTNLIYNPRAEGKIVGIPSIWDFKIMTPKDGGMGGWTTTTYVSIPKTIINYGILPIDAVI